MDEKEIQNWLDRGGPIEIEQLDDEADLVPVEQIFDIAAEWRSHHDEMGERVVRYQDQQFDLAELYPVANQYIEAIDLVNKRCLGAVFALLNTMDSGAPALKFLVWGVGKRAADLSFGYVDQVRKLNINVAAALPRLQLDNFLRLNLLYKVGPDEETLLNALLEGKPLDKVVDPLWKKPTGKGRTPPSKRLTDGRLRHHAREYSWVDTIYKESSRWVHQSDRSHGAAWRFIDEQRFVGSVTNRPDMYPEPFLRDVSWAMLQATLAATDIVQYFVIGAEQHAQATAT